jgi:hypothetical protein
MKPTASVAHRRVRAPQRHSGHSGQNTGSKALPFLRPAGCGGRHPPLWLTSDCSGGFARPPGAIRSVNPTIEVLFLEKDVISG